MLFGCIKFFSYLQRQLKMWRHFGGHSVVLNPNFPHIILNIFKKMAIFIVNIDNMTSLPFLLIHRWIGFGLL